MHVIIPYWRCVQSLTKQVPTRDTRCDAPNRSLCTIDTYLVPCARLHSGIECLATLGIFCCFLFKLFLQRRVEYLCDGLRFSLVLSYCRGCGFCSI